MIKETQKTMSKLWLNHKMIFSLAMFFCCAAAYAQVKNPGNKKPAPISTIILQNPPAITDIREKLVQLALQNPNYEIADRRVAIAEYQVKKAKGSWLNPIILQGNINEFSIEHQKTTNGINPASFYPKYNIGANIPLDVFSAKKNDVKIARENLSIAQAEKNQHFREIKAQVLTKYEDYLLCQERLDFQSQVTQDARTAYLASEKDFQEGAIKQDEYNKSYRGYTDEKVRQFEYQRNYNVIKLELEAMIGISMDDLMKK
jgi:outer membrane protein TolC